MALSDDHIGSMALSNQDYIDLARWRIDELLGKAEKVFSQRLISPTLDINLKGTVSGKANTTLNTIYLNWDLFKKNVEDFLENTIPHEFCHLLTKKLYPSAKQSHGPEWKAVMRWMGYEPIRCHNYDLNHLQRRTVKKITYKCNCRTIELSLIRHNKIRNGRIYYCTICKSRLVQNL